MDARLWPPRRSHPDARLCRDARGRDGGVREELAKGSTNDIWKLLWLNVRNRGQTGKQLLVLSITGFDPGPVIGRIETLQRSSLLPYQGVLSFLSTGGIRQ
jgi:hypothetical protein